MLIDFKDSFLIIYGKKMLIFFPFFFLRLTSSEVHINNKAITMFVTKIGIIIEVYYHLNVIIIIILMELYFF